MRLKYRRQFILARSALSELFEWNTFHFDKYHLYTHPDISVAQVKNASQHIILAGEIYDANSYSKSNASILDDLSSKSGDLSSLPSNLKHYAGAYAIFWSKNGKTFAFSDALTLREIFYCTSAHNQIICASQPNTISDFARPKIAPQNNPAFKKYYNNNSDGVKWDPCRKWIGDETFYMGIKHLLPNHLLDINSLSVHRYWPDKFIKPAPLEKSIEICCRFLQSILKSMVHRHKIMMAVTAGTDSRTLLAASKGLEKDIYYFINNENLGHEFPDISIPKKMFAALNIPFHIHEIPDIVESEFRRIFLDNCFFASDRILPTIYNIYYKKLAGKVNVLGIGEIGRTRYGKEPKHPSPFHLTNKVKHLKDEYALGQAAAMLDELVPVGKKFGVNIMTLFYWENTLGNWGVSGNSESDIAIEEVNPMNSHFFYETMLGVDPKFAGYGKNRLFKMMIEKMWPELLNWPINPPYKFPDRIDAILHNTGLYDLLQELKFRIKRRL